MAIGESSRRIAGRWMCQRKTVYDYGSISYAGGILKMWRALVAVFVAGVVCVSASQTPKAVSSYTLKSWQNQLGKADQTDHKPVHEGSLMACTNVEPKKDAY